MNKIPFSKMHGLGNNYIYLNCLDWFPDDPAALSRAVSQVNTGIGSDGLILICRSEIADFAMRMYNADGSEAEMCGNGVRCVAKYVYEKKLTELTTIRLETKAGIKVLELDLQDNLVSTVKVDMGEPILSGLAIPTTFDMEQVVNVSHEISGQQYQLTCVSMGNPHAVIFVPKITDDHIHVIGKALEKDSIFPNAANIEFVEVINRGHLKMRVWERGSGETQACGTGACAVLVAAVLNELADRKATISLLGGDLEIEWAENNHIFKTGTAQFICDGEYINNG